MKKQEYLNIISDEIKKNENLLNDANNLIRFYTNLEGENGAKVKELIKNRDLYYTRIQMLKGIENLPLYQSIMSLNDEELNSYKEKLINNNIKELELIEEKIKEIKQDMVNSNTEIDNIYVLFKKTNDETYIDRAKEILNHIKNCKSQIDTLSKEKQIIENNINIISRLNDNNLKERLLNESGISAANIEKSLLMYRPDRIDKLVAPMCEDLDKLDSIIDGIKEYNTLKIKNIYQTLFIPNILNSYTFDSDMDSSIKWLSGLYNIERTNNEFKVFYEEDFEELDEKIGIGIDKINNDKVSLVECKEIINLFPNNILSCGLDDLDLLNGKMLNFGNLYANESLERIQEYNNEYMMLYNKNYQSKKILEKEELLKLKIRKLVKEVLDILWKNIINKIINCIKNVDHNTIFCRELDYCDVTEEIINHNQLIIEKDNYSKLSLFNVKILIEQILNKYDRIINSLIELKIDCNDKKNELIIEQKEREKKLKEIEDNINKVYNTISNQKLNIGDYDKIIGIFKNNKIIYSIVKVEREELINKVKKYSLTSDNIIDKLITNEEEQIIENKTNEMIDNNVNIENETDKKQKLSKETLIKIKDTIKKLGLSNEQIREIVNKIIKDDLLIDNILKLDKKGTLNKEQIKNVIKEITIDENTDFTGLISELYEKLDLDEETIKELGNEILKDRSLIIDVVKSNKKILFNMIKNDVMKKILKK